MRNRLMMLGVAIVASAVAGGLTGHLNARPVVGLDMCKDIATQRGLKAAILARVAERGGDVDAGFGLSLDTPRLVSADARTGRTECGGVVRLAVPEGHRAGLDGVSELSDTVRYSVLSGGPGGLTRVALIDGGEVMTDWLGAPPAPPARPSASLIRALATPAPNPTVVPTPPARVTAPEVVRVSAPASRPVAEAPAPRTTPRAAARTTVAPQRPSTPSPTPVRTAPVRPSPGRTAPAPAQTPPVATRSLLPPAAARIAATAPVIQPSFDCRRAATLSERTICGDASLASLDLRMAQTFARMRNNTDGKTSRVLHDQQRAWLRQRDTCRTRDCLTSMYQIRIRDLDRFG